MGAQSGKGGNLGPRLVGQYGGETEDGDNDILAGKHFEHQSCDPLLLPRGPKREGFARQTSRMTKTLFEPI